MIEILLVVGLGVFALFAWRTYNSLVRRRNKVRESLGGVYVQLQRRADLIPTIVETVRGYTTHERTALGEVVSLRGEFLELSREDVGRLGDNDGLLGTLLGRVFALSEDYPKLRANETFSELQEQLEETEDQIAAARRIYNANVADFNTGAESFPAKLISSSFGFDSMPFFQADPEAAELPEVTLD